MVTTIPSTDHLISDEQLDTMTTGQLQALELRLAQKQADRIRDPRAYFNFARHSVATGADWATTWATYDPHDDAKVSRGKHAGPPPDAPKDFYNTLPGMVDNLVKSRRIQDAMIVTLTKLADRAYSHDRDTVLGIPHGVNLYKSGKRWLADRFQLDSRQVSKFYKRAELVTAEPESFDRASQSELLPKLAAEYTAGNVPSENMDRVTQVAKQFYDFYQSVGLSKENAHDVLQTMDGVFTDAAARMKPAMLAEEATKWLNQVAHIVDPDGPPPEERLHKLKNSLKTALVNGKLHINIVTDVVNTELIEALILAGLNFRANQDKFRQDPEETIDPSDEETTAEPAHSPSESSTTQEDNDSTAADARLAAFHQQMDEAVDDPETYVETDDGRKVSREQMRKLDTRDRAEKAHDVFITMLKAQGKRSPGAEGMAEYKRAPAILWTVLDYETLLNLHQDKLPDQHTLDPEYKRLPGLAGFDTGPPSTLEPTQPVGEHHILSDASPPDGSHEEPRTRQGHPYVARGFQTGAISPSGVLADLCDAKVIPAVFNQAGVPLFVGRGKRLFSDDQILAAAMLGGCRGPGCRVPPVWTHGHHGTYWLHGGETDTTNLILLCHACHTHVHQGVWTPTWNNAGVLYWIPASWLDPTQTPVRNTYWD